MGLAPKPYSNPKNVLLESDLQTYRLFARGKVRDVYEDGDRLLIVATDRISAFDYILPTGIPDKGRVLTQMTLFWLDYLKDVVPNHFLSADTSDLPPEFAGRSMWVKRAEMFQVECVARGYLVGLRMEGLPEDRRSVRHRVAAGLARIGRPARADLHPRDQGRQRARRKHIV